MSTITAAELKKRGVSALPEVMDDSGEAVITVRGRETYVVMTLEKYSGLRESELTQAVRETRADYLAGRIADRTVADHIRRLDNDL